MSSHLVSPAQFEEMARDAFNKSQGTKARKFVVSIGKTQHEFDLYQKVVVAGGISTSPWVNRTVKHTNNSGGQDRVVAELLWLHLCNSVKRKVLILKEKDMADGINKRLGGNDFFSPTVEVWLYNSTTDNITHLSNL
jgi:hypothetical protein